MGRETAPAPEGTARCRGKVLRSVDALWACPFDRREGPTTYSRGIPKVGERVSERQAAGYRRRSDRRWIGGGARGGGGGGGRGGGGGEQSEVQRICQQEGANVERMELGPGFGNTRPKIRKCRHGIPVNRAALLGSTLQTVHGAWSKQKTGRKRWKVARGSVRSGAERCLGTGCLLVLRGVHKDQAQCQMN